jgi:integrase
MRQARWLSAIQKRDIDPRHSGNTFAAAGGASLRYPMDRMGHDSFRAAMIYQHKTTGASRSIAASILRHDPGRQIYGDSAAGNS